MLEIHVDVRRLAPLLRDEPFEQQVIARGVKQTAELAADPRPWQRMSFDRAKRTIEFTVRK